MRSRLTMLTKRAAAFITVLGLITAAAQQLDGADHPKALRDIMWVWATPDLARPGPHTLDTLAQASAAQRAELLGTPHVIMAGSGLPQEYEQAERLTAEVATRARLVWEIAPDGGAMKPPFAYDQTVARLARLAQRYPQIEGVLLDDLTSVGIDQGFKPEHLKQLRRQLAEQCPQVQLWGVLYSMNFGRQNVQQYVEQLDVISLWVWHADHLVDLEKHVAHCEAAFPGKPIVLGLYLRDYGSSRPMPQALMEMQCETARRLAHAGRIRGIVFLTIDNDPPIAHWTAHWIRRVGAEPLGKPATPTGPLSAHASPAEEPGPVRSTHDPNVYLVVDDHWIAVQRGLERVIHTATPLERALITPDDPVSQMECAWGNVIREADGRFRMWYMTMGMGMTGGGPHEMAAAGVWGRGDDFSFHPRGKGDVRDVHVTRGRYAESSDGVEWTKPSLGLIPYDGNQMNNLILDGQRAAEQTDAALTNFDGYTVLRDEAEADPAKRYKMLAHWESVHFWDNHQVSGSLARPDARMAAYTRARGKYMTCSPDGIHWTQPLTRIEFPDGGGDRFLVVRDHRNQQWWGYSRSEGHGGGALATSKDLIHWSAPVAEPSLRATSTDLPAIESLIPFNYGNQDLGFAIGMDKAKGILNAYLVSHHDGQPWQWVDARKPVIPAGKPASYHATGAVPLHNEPFIVGDQLFVYFNAFAYQKEPRCPEGIRTIGLATIRRDGFVGLKAAEKGGHLVTRPIRVTGSKLFVNVEQRGPGGSVAVGLARPDRTPIAGFAADEAVPLTTDGVRCAVAWRGQDHVSSLAGQEIVLDVHVARGAVLYAFGFLD